MVEAPSPPTRVTGIAVPVSETKRSSGRRPRHRIAGSPAPACLTHRLKSRSATRSAGTSRSNSARLIESRPRHCACSFHESSASSLRLRWLRVCEELQAPNTNVLAMRTRIGLGTLSLTALLGHETRARQIDCSAIHPSQSTDRNHPRCLDSIGSRWLPSAKTFPNLAPSTQWRSRAANPTREFPCCEKAQQ